jgi:crotonobetainyl-CoA:carnitine CoA-transferase CaiB-like acyl-CoA transferase
MSQPELAENPSYVTHLERGKNATELDGLIAEWTKTKTAADLTTLLDEHGVVVGPIYTVADIAKDPHFKARDMLHRMDDPVFGDITVPGVVPKLSESAGEISWLGPPEPGTHNKEVYGELLGIGDQELAEMKNDGVI